MTVVKETSGDLLLCFVVITARGSSRGLQNASAIERKVHNEKVQLGWDAEQKEKKTHSIVGGDEEERDRMDQKRETLDPLDVYSVLNGLAAAADRRRRIVGGEVKVVWGTAGERKSVKPVFVWRFYCGRVGAGQSAAVITCSV